MVAKVSADDQAEVKAAGEPSAVGRGEAAGDGTRWNAYWVDANKGAVSYDEGSRTCRNIAQAMPRAVMTDDTYTNS
ncbi:hypothetical protein [Nonomuraea sp. NPDC048901]|uniref:hypothetical protein n=1 Tax=Nonomuraea sp. NPDC048901 TaxID=3155627 RepID=UPI0033DC22F8